jgi:hypothetical protein
METKLVSESIIRDNVLKSFQSDLGQQLDLLFSTGDGTVLIRDYEAIRYCEENNIPLDTIKDWMREDFIELDDAYHFIQNSIPDKIDNNCVTIDIVELSELMNKFHQKELDSYKELQKWIQDNTVTVVLESHDINRDEDDLPF